MQFFHASRLLSLESRFCRFSCNAPCKKLHVRLLFEVSFWRIPDLARTDGATLYRPYLAAATPPSATSASSGTTHSA
jgi:hypothetical protein